MTANQIQTRGTVDGSPAHIIATWLKEIAYQLAVMNERQAERDKETQDAADKRVAAILRKVGIPDL